DTVSFHEGLGLGNGLVFWQFDTPVNCGRKWSGFSAMKCNLSVVCYRACIATVLAVGGATLAHAQSAPEMREILNRLDRLEKDNQALMQELRQKGGRWGRRAG